MGYVLDDVISVIVPIYKVEQYLERCIKSIVNQTYQNLEIILVDDGSPDMCPQLCDVWAGRDQRIRVIHKENGGLSSARNAGLQNATGEWVTFVDPDDYCEQEMIEMLYRCAVENSANLSVCGYKMKWDEEREVSHCKKERPVLSLEEFYKSIISEDNIGNFVWCKLYRRSLWEGVEFPASRAYEDIATLYLAASQCDRIAVTSYIGYVYVQRENSLSNLPNTVYLQQQIENMEYRNWAITKKYPELSEICASSVKKISVVNFNQISKNYRDKYSDLMWFRRKISENKTVRTEPRYEVESYLILACPRLAALLIYHTARILRWARKQ